MPRWERSIVTEIESANWNNLAGPGATAMRLKMRLQRLEVRQTSILKQLPPEQPVSEPFPYEAFQRAVESGQVGSVGGMDLDAV
jgi:hypothetical protein